MSENVKDESIVVEEFDRQFHHYQALQKLDFMEIEFATHKTEHQKLKKEKTDNSISYSETESFLDEDLNEDGNFLVK
jgi:hypothetical protein